jgi:Tol biopolymer transport system component
MDGQIQVASDNQTVFFNRVRSDGGRPQIMQVSINGGAARALMPETEPASMFPRLSRDGSRLAYHTYTYDSQSGAFNTGVRIVGLKGGKVDEEAEKVELGMHPEFRWSPDGKALTFINRNAVDNLWNLSVEDKKETPLTEFTSVSLISPGRATESVF